MPIITIENAGELTIEQKQKLAEEITKTVVDITGKPSNYVYTKIIEIPRENFAIGGKLLKS